LKEVPKKQGVLVLRKPFTVSPFQGPLVYMADGSLEKVVPTILYSSEIERYCIE
jgi:hypothetical protein